MAFAAYQGLGGQSFAPQTYAAPRSYGAIGGTMSYATAAAPITMGSYAPRGYAGAPLRTAAPVSTIAAPATFSTYAAPTYAASTYAAPTMVSAAPVYEEIIQYPTAIGNRDLLAMGNVVSERVVSIDELAARGAYAATEPIEVGIVSSQPVMYETIAPAPVYYNGAVEYIQAPGVEYMVTGGAEYMVGATEYVSTAGPVTYLG